MQMGYQAEQKNSITKLKKKKQRMQNIILFYNFCHTFHQTNISIH